jgi:signal transduction histidine kinase
MSKARSGTFWLARTALVAAALAGGVALFATYGPHLSVGRTLTIAGEGLSIFAPLPIAYVLGACLPRWIGVCAVAWMATTFELNAGYVNPFVLVVLVAPWLVGVMVRDRRQLAQQLEETAQQLRAEGDLLAEESVRYERTRIARELHDIVAHCVSVMVVQAYAGERLTTRDRESAVEAFDHITEAAEQAQLEIGHLVDLLACEPSTGSQRELGAGVAELVAGAVATGLRVNLRVQGNTDRLPEATSLAAYRVIQESITNALKHAPGAPIEILVDCGHDAVNIAVLNAATSSATGPPLEHSGGGHGLTGMRDRASALGGSFQAGVRRNGDWQVSVRLPLSVNDPDDT